MRPPNSHTAQVAGRGPGCAPRGPGKCAHTVNSGPLFIKRGTNTPNPEKADRVGRGGIQPQAASRRAVVALQTVSQTGTLQSRDASGSGRVNKVLLRIPSECPPCLAPTPRWSIAAQHPG